MKWIVRAIGLLLLAGGIAFLVFRVPDTDADEMWAKYGASPSQAVELADGALLTAWYEALKDRSLAVLRQARWRIGV